MAISYQPILQQLHWALHNSTCNMSENSMDFHYLSCLIRAHSLCHSSCTNCIASLASKLQHPLPTIHRLMARQNMSTMKDTLSEAQAALAKSKNDMAYYYNQHHTPAPTFTAGDKVFLDASNIHMTCPSKKLSHCFLGPFPVVHPVGSHAYRL